MSTIPAVLSIPSAFIDTHIRMWIHTHPYHFLCSSVLHNFLLFCAFIYKFQARISYRSNIRKKLNSRFTAFIWGRSNLLASKEKYEIRQLKHVQCNMLWLTLQVQCHKLVIKFGWSFLNSPPLKMNHWINKCSLFLLKNVLISINSLGTSTTSKLVSNTNH